MQITSSVFQNDEPLDAKYARDGMNINPPLTFSEIPDGAETLALIVEDPDAVSGNFTHWLVYNMSPATIQIIEGELPMSGIEGRNDAGECSYYGPAPPKGTGTHRYIFRLLALSTTIEADSPEEVDRKAFDDIANEHIVDQAEITGTFAATE